MNGMRGNASRQILLLLGALVLVVVVIGALDRVPGRDAGESSSGPAEVGPGGTRGPAELASESAVAAPAADRSDRTSPAPSGGDAADAGGSSSSVDDAVFRPIPIPAEFGEKFGNDEELAAFHAALEREPDSEWGRAIQQFLEEHFNSTLDLSEFNILSLECRTKSCEILAVGYNDDALRGWMASAYELFESSEDFEALMGGPGTGGCGGGDLAPGMMSLTCTFRLLDEPPDDSAPAETYSLDAPYPDGVTVEPVFVAEDVMPVIEASEQMYELHRRLEQEATDYSWSSYIEPLIEEYLAGLDSTRDVTVVGVTCRTTLCEVQMTGFADIDFINWLPDMLEFQRLDWHDLTIAGLDGSDVIEGEASGFVWYLQRRQGD